MITLNYIKKHQHKNNYFGKPHLFMAYLLPI